MDSIDKRAVWPGWETVRLIGRGSFGSVYEIRRDVFGVTESAALKLISIPQNDSELQELRSNGYDEESIRESYQEYLDSIIAEYAMMRKLDGHTNVVNCDDIRTLRHADGVGWDILIKMELLTPLSAALDRAAPEELARKVGVDLCNALVLCRKHSIVHRDIKPANVFVSEYGDFKLGDFGIAKTVEKTSGGTKIGTYNYMAPEVYHDEPYGHSADIYSLGLVLYWLLNERRLPFLPLPPERIKAGMEEQARRRRLSGEALPPPVHGSAALKRIVLKACAYDLKDRYNSAEEMLRDLEALGQNGSGAGGGTSSSGRKLLPILLICLGAAAVLTAVFLLLRPRAVQDTGKTAPVSQPVQTMAAVTAAPIEEPAQMEAAAPIDEPAAQESVTDLRATEEPVVHNWAPATCTQPETCTICGEARGSALGHDWAPATCTEPETCKVCGETRGSALGHDWAPATCTEPEICKVCGKTEGSALGHTWKAATCTEPETCSVCGETRGEPAGHSWKNASCTEPSTCTVCGATRGASAGHSWTAATCTRPKTCTVCGKTEGSALGHTWKAATCTSPKTCTVCGATEGSALGHSWKAATCTNPKTCTVCGKTEGSALGHTWKAATCTNPKTCTVCGKTEGSALGHTWKAATCTSPKTCTVCGKTEGSALGHTWKAATCTNPKTCTVCGKTEGSAKGHTWKAATCTSPKTCTVCGKTEGSALGHTWKAATCTSPKTCTVCGKTEGSALGHDWAAATYTSPETCRRCGLTRGEKLTKAYTYESIWNNAQWAADHDSEYSTYSYSYKGAATPNGTRYLEVPSDYEIFQTGRRMRIRAEKGNFIFIMPVPETGHGVLGTVPHQEYVTVVAERWNDSAGVTYYFFVTDDGKAGWNSSKYFTSS